MRFGVNGTWTKSGPELLLHELNYFRVGCVNHTRSRFFQNEFQVGLPSFVVGRVSIISAFVLLIGREEVVGFIEVCMLQSEVFVVA